MTQAEELLNSLTPDEIALYTAKPGIEDHIIVDDNRNITVPDMLKRIAVQYDNCIETVTFDCPRYWDENDLSTMNIYINYVRSDSVGGLYLAKNIRVDEEDSNIIHFDWLIGDEITIVSGALEFAISAKKMGEDEELRWYSEINNQMVVSKGLDNADIVVEEHPDILNEILAKVDNMTVDNDVKNAIKTLQTDLDTLENKVDNFDIPDIFTTVTGDFNIWELETGFYIPQLPCTLHTYNYDGEEDLYYISDGILQVHKGVAWTTWKHLEFAEYSLYEYYGWVDGELHEGNTYRYLAESYMDQNNIIDFLTEEQYTTKYQVEKIVNDALASIINGDEVSY